MRTLVVVAALSFLANGCASLHPTPQMRSRGLLILIPGLQGKPMLIRPASNGIRDAGYLGEVRLFDWNRSFMSIDNLIDAEGNQQRAEGIASQIVAYRADNPNAPIDVVALSAGAGLGLRAVEELPANVHVRHLILLQGAVSPAYDLHPALEHIDGKLVNFFCRLDAIVLGAGTSLLGTFDRKRSSAAGFVGFNAPLPDRVEQVTWHPKWIASGHWGTHTGMLSGAFHRDFVGPYVTHRRPETAR